MEKKFKKRVQKIYSNKYRLISYISSRFIGKAFDIPILYIEKTKVKDSGKAIRGKLI